MTEKVNKIKETREALLDAIQKQLQGSATGVNKASRGVLHLAEAHAWLTAPSQSHGGGANQASS